MITVDDLFTSLKSVGLKPTDTVLIHGNAGVAAQLNGNCPEAKMKKMVGAIVEYFSDGTIIVPAFTYSASQGNVFIPEKTTSEVGMFSEYFRKHAGVQRSLHSMFSVSCIGSDANTYLDANCYDCFGADTVFDLLVRKNANILFMGCDLDKATFVHHVEQTFQVPYRYHKLFNARIKTPQRLLSYEVNCYVRDLELDPRLNLANFQRLAIESKKLIEGNIGRFQLKQISAQDFFDLGISMLKRNPFALVLTKGVKHGS